MLMIYSAPYSHASISCSTVHEDHTVRIGLCYAISYDDQYHKELCSNTDVPMLLYPLNAQGCLPGHVLVGAAILHASDVRLHPSRCCYTPATVMYGHCAV